MNNLKEKISKYFKKSISIIVIPVLSIFSVIAIPLFILNIPLNSIKNEKIKFPSISASIFNKDIDNSNFKNKVVLKTFIERSFNTFLNSDKKIFLNFYRYENIFSILLSEEGNEENKRGYSFEMIEDN